MCDPWREAPEAPLDGSLCFWFDDEFVRQLVVLFDTSDKEKCDEFI